MTYIKVFVDWRKAIEPLSDAARGRLFTALLDYAETGKVPKMTGNERILFPMMQAQLDRDAASYDVRCEASRANGVYGGRPRKTQENLENQVGFSETKKTQDKEKEKEKEKDKDSFSRGAPAPGERKNWRKRPPGPSAPAPETVAADMKRMERFLLELRKEAAELDRKKAEAQEPDGTGGLNGGDRPYGPL